MRVLLALVSLALLCGLNVFGAVLLEENYLDYGIISRVPRGLILSINKDVLFDENGVLLKISGLSFLDKIAKELGKIDNDIVIEGHGYSLEDSLMQAKNVEKYFIRYANINPEKLFAIGFGDFAPMTNAPKSRLDFVIIDYKE